MAVERKHDNRRAAYRVRPESVHELDLAVLEKRYRVVRGRVTDVAVGGAQVEFDRHALADLDAGDRVMLALASERYNFDRTMWARIVAAAEAADAKTLSVSFDASEALQPEDELLYALFNRRAKYRRIELDEPGTLAARVGPCAGADAARDFPVTIRDISSAGICFAVTAADDAVLSAHDELLLQLALPGRSGIQHVHCQVRRRIPSADEVRYGCEFDWSASASTLALLEELIAYVQDAIATDEDTLERLAGDRRTQRAP